VARRGAVTADWLRSAGYGEPVDAVRVGRWWCSVEQLQRWRRAARDLVAAAGGELPVETVRRRLEVPDPGLLAHALAEEPRLEVVGAVVRDPAVVHHRSPALTVLLDRLARDPLDAPDLAELRALAVPPAEIARAVAAGEIVQLDRGTYVGAGSVDRVVAALRQLPAPFTASEARAALGLTRRVAIPMLEHLDRLRITRRVGTDRREFTRPA
jgi:selenocysteine-specific elongation factor